jgi:23S rRNA pseudouridine1911/1915/1917 synthase
MKTELNSGMFDESQKTSDFKDNKENAQAQIEVCTKVEEIKELVIDDIASGEADVDADDDDDDDDDDYQDKDNEDEDSTNSVIRSNVSVIVNEEESDIRIDVFLNKIIDNMSRSQIQKLIEENNVSVNDKIIKSNYKTKTRDRIYVNIPLPRRLEIEAEDIKLDIIYEDEDLVVINKPQGMVVHPAAGNYSGTLVNALLACCKNLSGINGVIRPGIVHRIDKDTSGVLVVAKNDLAHKSLAEQIKAHTVNRIYMALVEGIIKPDTGTIDQPLGRHPIERKKIAVIKNGRNAITHYRVIERYKNYTLVEAKLETGRTHQIRVHMAFIGHPLVGDPTYGNKKQKFNLKGQMLHAKTLGFIHPRTHEYMEFTVPVPSYFEKMLQTLKK